MTVQQIADRIRALPDGSRILVLGPLIKDRKTEGERVFAAARRQGFVRVRVDGELMDLDAAPTLDKYKRHTIEVVVDRLIVRHADADGRPFDPENPDPDASRLADSVETALRLGEGAMLVAPADGDGFEEQRYSERYSCPFDGTTIDELEPRSFSFNSPHGACPTCTGLGIRLEFDIDRVIPDRNRSIADGALAPWRSMPDRDVVAAQDDRGGVPDARLGLQGHDQGPAAEGARLPPPRRARREGRGPLPPRPRRELVRRHVRGRHHEPRAALPRDRFGVHPDRAREVHGRATLPGLRRPAPQAGSARRHHRRARHRGGVGDDASATRSPGRRRCPRASASASRRSRG